MAKNKFKIIDQKMTEIAGINADFHESTDKLEELYRKDIEQRKKHYHEVAAGKNLTAEEGADSKYKSGLNLEQVDEIFDQLEAEENKSFVMILMSISNLSLLGVIGLAAYKFKELSSSPNSFGKNRIDWYSSYQNKL